MLYCSLFNIFCKPLRVYRALLIFVSAVILYAIVFNEEFSTEDAPITEHYEISYIENGIQDNESKLYDKKHESIPVVQRTKYILLWTPNVTPLDQIKEGGRKPFISSNCDYTNCFLTRRRRYFSDQTKFDAIVFSIPALNNLQNLPKNRLSRQKFVAASTEPPEKYPIINPIYDGYFNWTWTYRLKSDILWRHFRIFNSKGNEVGPRKNMIWLKDYAPEDYTIGDIEIDLGVKNKAIMWMKTCCKCKSFKNFDQFKYIMDLEKELSSYGLFLATYSNCTGYDSCGDIMKCNNLIMKNYYFYLAFEDYFDEDYVTKTLLFAVQNLAVPVVMGNYSRFLPPGSYLDAKQLSAKALAAVIDDSVGDFSSFRKYFRWVKYYNYKSVSMKSEICNICTALNNRQIVKNYTVYNNFRKMWNGEESVLVSDFLLNVFENDKSLKRIAHNGKYSEVRNMFKNKHFPDPRDSIYVFDMDGLNLTSTEETNFIPYELTTDTANN